MPIAETAETQESRGASSQLRAVTTRWPRFVLLGVLAASVAVAAALLLR
jgi:hypothetical protein